MKVADKGGEGEGRKRCTVGGRKSKADWEKGGGRRVAGSSQRAIKEIRESFCHANQMAKQSVRKDFHPVLQKTPSHASPPQQC